MSQDPFVGTWKLNLEESRPDPNYRPKDGTMQFIPVPTGLVMIAYGAGPDGKVCTEIPVLMQPDGQGRPVPFTPPGSLGFCNRPNPNTLEGRVEHEGKVLGGGSYRVSEDGGTLTCTMSGMGVKGPFKTVVVFNRA